MPQPKFPQDKAGFLYKLKHAGLSAIERQAGHPEKHDALIQTLKVLAKHAQERYQVQRTSREKMRKEIYGVSED